MWVSDVPATDLMVISQGHQARTAAAQACRNLLAAARADLAEQKQSQVQQALSVERIFLVSAYRSASQQFTNWQRNFPRYYQQTASRRAALTSGEHGQEAVNLLTSHISGILAAPGYSLHNNGLAVDFGTKDNGNELGANKNPTSIQRWQQSWLFNWLQANAVRYNYYQNTSIDEPWHWEGLSVDKYGQASSGGIVGYRGSLKQACPYLSRLSAAEYRATTQPSQSEKSELFDSGVFYQSLLEPVPIAL